jgi:hypothetical protein
MSYRIELNDVHRRKLSACLRDVPFDSAKAFWVDLKRLFKVLAESPTEFGEAAYDFKHSKFQSRLGVRAFLSVQFAVSPDDELVVVQLLTLCDNHPYPAEIEKIVNHEPF